jgi:hypothetical protein
VRSENEDVEARLRQFRPRRPAAIPDERLQLLRGPIWVVAAAGIAAVMLIAARLQKPADIRRPEAAPVNVRELTTLALEKPGDFDAVLSRMSRELLPDVTVPGGVLQPLSRVF